MESTVIKPKSGDSVRGFGAHQYGTRIIEVTETQFSIRFSSHWNSSIEWYPISELQLEVEDKYEGNSWVKKQNR